MNLHDFMRFVLPATGNVVLGMPEPLSNGGTWFKHRKFKDVDAASTAALAFDADGNTVYFAVNSFNDFYTDDKGKTVIRKQGNVCASRAIFDDYDVKPGKENHYQSKGEALQDIVKLAKALRLSPSVVDSGGGYHVYFHLEDDIDEDTWKELSNLKRDVTTHLALMVDRVVDCDSARVLRPVGVHNRKYDTPVPVTLRKLGKRYSTATLRDTFTKFITDHNVSPAFRAASSKSESSFSAIAGAYPPSDANKVADHCSAVRDFRDTKGNIEEPHWHRAIGVVKFCEDGDKIIHEWSSGHVDYSEFDTQQKIDHWDYGSTSCVEMDKHISCMEACPVSDKCKFPIHLGYSEEATSVAAAIVVDDTQPVAPTPAGTVVAGQTIPHWPAGFRWNGGSLGRSYTKDGVVDWRSFCRTCIYPLNRIRNTEGEWIVHWRALEKNGDWREFFMPMNELASTDQMAKTLASHEVFLHPTRTARTDMADFAVAIIEELQKWRIETKTYSQFGWLPDRTGFIMGTKMVTEKGTTDVLCEDSVPLDIQCDFGRSGTLDEWVSNIDKLYTRPGAEPMQFALCHSMGSVLVELMGSSNWHGLPLAFTGHGSTGKTTMSKIALGFYGRPKLMERQTGQDGSTLGAAIKRVAIMGALPVLLDEFSGKTPEEMTRAGYALANGRDKERLNSSAKFSTIGIEWFKNSFITSNDSIVEAISSLPAGYKVEATQLRFFEVQLPEGYTTSVFPDITKQFVENHMDHVYGEACLPYLRFIMKNTDWVRRQITAARDKFNPSSTEDNKERFYRDTIVTAWVAGKIASKIGLITFDVNQMKKWAEDHVKTMRENRKENNASIGEQLAVFISTLQGRLIVTKRLGHGNSRKEESAMMLRAPAVGRVCTEEERTFVTVKSVSDWCKDNGVAPKAMKDELSNSGYTIRQSSMYIGQGSTVPSGLARCYELNYRKLMTGSSLVLTEDADK